MGGDHKCPVCQATFTRPQHVARHMRSHTGDRPYKCQYCGDQFARSDLLSRHVNKCHSNEKPPPSAPGSRRKGSASASRATTSKQACDQCVQSSLPCDGCNPCAKCVQRKCRCTFVKFHRQTAPVGPGHNPRLHPSASVSQPHLASVSHLQPASRLHPYSQDDLLLGPAPAGGHQSMADNLYSESFSFSPLYPSSYPTSSSYPSSNSSSYPASSASSSRGDTSLPLASDPDFTDKYKAHTEMLRRTGAMNHPRSMGAPSSPTTGPPGSVGEWYDQVNQQERNNRELLHDIDRQFPVFASGSFPGPRSGFTPTGTGFTPTGLGFPSTGTGFTPTSGFPPGYAGSFANSGTGAEAGPGFSQGTGSGFTPGSSTFPTGFTPGGAFPLNSSILQDRRRGSADFGGSSSSEHGYTGSEGGSSMPSSATSSNVHLPGYQGSSEFVPPHMQHQSEQGHGHGHHRRPSSASSLGHQPHRRGEYPAEGGFSATFGLMSLDDPNVVAGLATDGTPFFSNRGGGVGGDSEDPNVTPMPHSSTGGGGGGGVRGHRSNTLPTPSREIAEAEWWNMYMKRTPGTAGGGAGRPRVASLPSSKTPTTLPDRFISSVHSNNHAGRMHLAIPPPKNGNTGPGAAGTMHVDEDLRSYEAAVKARGAPMALSLRLPRGKRGEAGKGKSASAGTSPQVPNLGYARAEVGKGEAEGRGKGSRPGSAAGSSSLANVFGGAASAQQRPGSSGGRPASQHQQHVTFAPMDVTGSASPPAAPYGHSAYRMGVASSASPSSRASSTDPGSGGSEVGGSGPEALRPSFKRLPSQTLGPANAKRALLSRDEEEEDEEEGFGSEGGVSGDEGPARHEMSLGFGLGSGGLAERRRRRMSAPSGTSPIAATFVGAGHDLA